METKEAYLNSTTAHKRITREEELDAAEKRCNGDWAGADVLIKANLKLVVSMVRRNWQDSGVEEMDMIAAGNHGLVIAAHKYDPNVARRTGAKFSTYAALWIRQKITILCSKQTSKKIVHMPVSAYYNYRKIKYVEHTFLQRYGKSPTNEEIAAKTKFPLITVERLRDLRLSPAYLDAPVMDGSKTPLSQLIGRMDESCVSMQKEDVLRVLSGCLSILPERKQTVIKLRFGLDGYPVHTLEEARLIIGCTRERVRQLQNEALKTLKIALCGRLNSTN